MRDKNEIWRMEAIFEPIFIILPMERRKFLDGIDTFCKMEAGMEGANHSKRRSFSTKIQSNHIPHLHL
jgi:hypothetical protein